MSTISDSWYVRFPDGRVLRADSTAAVRQYLGSGRIPAESSVRRSPDEEWVSLEWSEEFADVLKARRSQPESGRRSTTRSTSTHARLDPDRLRTLGVQGGLKELLAALDCALAPRKVWIGLIAGLIGGLFAALGHLPPIPWERLGGPLVGWTAAVAGCVLVGCIAAVLLTQLTYVELSRLRPARWEEGRVGLGGSTFRLLFALLPVVGGAVGLLLLLQWLPGWLMNEDRASWGVAREVGATAAAVLAQLLAVAIWPLIGFSLLLAPLLVVEDCSVGSAWRQWRALLRPHGGRALLCEMLALTVALAFCLPLALPWLTLAAFDPGPSNTAHLAVAWTRHLLLGLAVGLLFVYLVVANVFIYLHLRYETSSGRSG
jgi:hypothetical protein